jgi:hypothetical protein
VKRNLVARMEAAEAKLARAEALRTQAGGRRARREIARAGVQLRGAVKVLRSRLGATGMPPNVRQFLIRELTALRSDLVPLRATLTPA